MKRILIITFAIAAFASCTKTEVTYAPADEIEIVPANENVTKSMMGTNEFNLTSNFKVWSWFNPVGAKDNVISTFQAGLAANATNKTEPYIKQKLFVPHEIKVGDQTVTKWGGDVAYYWPSAGSLVFAGYHAPNLSDDKVTYTFSENENKMVFSEVTPGTVSNTGYDEDIMYFNMTSSSYNKSSANVPVTFKHALSWITITLAKRANPVIDATIKVSDVSFTSVVPEGTGTVDGLNGIQWVGTETAEHLHIFNDSANPKELKYKESEDADGKITYEPDVITLTEHLFIPQEIKGLLTITYSVISGDGSVFTDTYPVYLENIKGAPDKWEASKHYTYNLSIGTDEIFVTPTVGDWGEEELDVEIPLSPDYYKDLENNGE